MRDDLDILLSQPLAEMPDNGFSRRVADRVLADLEVRRLRRERRWTEIAIGLVVLAVLLLPFTGPGTRVMGFALSIQGAALLSLPLGALVLLSSLIKFSR
jgi:hypothetical protein